MRCDLEDRFWSKVRIGDGCWLWTAARQRNGYGRFAVSHGHVRFAHRVALEMSGVTIPDGMLACHTCDNRWCVRPSHLFVGTAEDNTADMVAKGRHRGGGPRGEASHVAKLTAAQVAEIRKRLASGERRVSIARAFGVSPGAVGFIKSGRNWAGDGDAV